MAYFGILQINGKDYLVGSTLYGTCSTAASVADKISEDVEGFNYLEIGTTIHIKMYFANTANAPTLNINSTGAYPIYSHGADSPMGTTTWHGGSVVSFTFDGSAWVMNDQNDLFQECTGEDIDDCFK